MGKGFVVCSHKNLFHILLILLPLQKDFYMEKCTECENLYQEKVQMGKVIQQMNSEKCEMIVRLF